MKGLHISAKPLQACLDCDAQTDKFAINITLCRRWKRLLITRYIVI